MWDVIDCKHRTPVYVESGIPVVSPGDISAGPLDLRRCHRFVSHEDWLDLADELRRCRPGDLVYSRNASAGTASIVLDDAPFTMGQDVCRITSAAASQSYLMYVLNYAVEPQLEAARVGSTITRINVDQIKSLKIPVPANDEQVRIASAVERVITEHRAGVELLTAQVALLLERKRALITAAVSGDFDVTTASARTLAG